MYVRFYSLSQKYLYNVRMPKLKNLLYILLAILIISVFVYFFTQTSASSSYTLPKIIWMYWDTPELPKLIQQIQTYNRPKLEGWDIRFLNNTLLPNYIHNEEYPKNYNSLKHQHQADWIRMNLLSKHGGCWMDASIIVNDPDALNRLHRQSVARQSHFTGFSYRNNEANSISDRNISLYIENWFIMAPVDSIIIREWYHEYHKAVEMGFVAYKHNLTNENVDLHMIWNKSIDTEIYLTQHACLQYILQKKLAVIPPIIINHAEKDMLFTSGDSKESRMKLLRNHPEEARKIPYIKLIGSDRGTGIDITPFFNTD